MPEPMHRANANTVLIALLVAACLYLILTH